MPKRKRKISEEQRWLRKEWRRNKKHFEDDAVDKLFGSERGCSAVFVALQAIAYEAWQNKDTVIEDSCFRAMIGLAKGRTAFLRGEKASK